MLARYSSSLRRWLAALFVFAALVRPAAAVDWTDIWWVPSESGWGVNFIQANNFIFATFFVYGPGNQPIWYTGQMTVDSNGVWSGPLYLTTGTYFGNPWNSSQKTNTQVGTVTFTPSTSYAGTLTYNVNNVNVAKSIQRQTLTTIPLSGKYSGAYLEVYSNCNDPNNNGGVTYFANFTVTQTTGGSLTIVVDSSDPLTMAGAYIQDGQLYRVPNAAYTLGSNNLTSQLSQIKATDQGIEGQWVADVSSVWAGCIEQGYFSALFITN